MRVGCFSFVVVFLLARGVHSPAVGGFAALRMRQVKPLFLLWEKWDVFNLQLFFLPARLGPQPSRWRLCRLTDGAYPLRVKPLFLLIQQP